MSHDAYTLNAYGEMMSGWQDSFMLKGALQPYGDQSPISRQSVVVDCCSHCGVLSSMFCGALLYVFSSFATILMGKRELVALLCLSFCSFVILLFCGYFSWCRGLVCSV